MTLPTNSAETDIGLENERLRFALQAAGVGTWDYNLLTGEAQWSSICKQLFGLADHAPVTAAILLDQVHPDDRERVAQANAHMLSPFSDGEHNIRFRTLHPEGTFRWVEAKGSTKRDEHGQVLRFSGIVQDVTGQIQAQQELAQQKTYLQNALDIAELGTYRIDAATNTGYYADTIGQWFGMAPASQPMEAIFSKIHPDDRPVVQQIINESLESEDRSRHDITYRVTDATGKGTRYLRSIGKALYVDGQPQSINGIIQDVTTQVLASQWLVEAESRLRGAIELAQLGTWELDVATGVITYSDRIKSWFGFRYDEASLTDAYNPIHENDRSRVAAAIAQALRPGSTGVYDEEYILVEQHTGLERIVHAQGKTFFDAQGQPITLSGTAQDVTQQRQTQAALQQQVEQRTGQLQASVNDLERSNQNLQQFAYVASHDLQEPLRKIQSFGDLLKSQYADQLGEGVDHLNRMQTAASRMSVLIKDLLSFSRISTRQESTALVSLTEVSRAVLSTLEVIMTETNAQLRIDPLPSVIGDASQLRQLFQNLLSNALKFRRPGLSPVIQVSTHSVAAADLPPAVRPARVTSVYHCIQVSDNGIGFEQKYVDRIFQVFQRLHGRSEFAGTGIGLAICEKVMANHGGAITATSQPSQGATFSMYFPQ